MGPTEKHWRNIETMQGSIGKCLGLWRHEMIGIWRICSRVRPLIFWGLHSLNRLPQCLGAIAMEQQEQSDIHRATILPPQPVSVRDTWLSGY